MLFNKVLGENEKCVFYFYLITEGTFWPNQYNEYRVQTFFQDRFKKRFHFSQINTQNWDCWIIW